MKRVTAPSPTSAIVPCPRCQQPLFDPNGLGWCKACGYCRSVMESGPKVQSTPSVSSIVSEAQAPPNALAAVVTQTPIWLIVTVVGVVAIVGAAFAIDRFMPLSPLRRAVLTTSVIGGGVFLTFVGQFIALLKIAPDDPTLSFKDALFPFRLYGLILGRLPKGQFMLYLCVWGLAAAISAGVLIGGLEHWFTYLPKSDKNQPQKTTKKT